MSLTMKASRAGARRFRAPGANPRGDPGLFGTIFSGLKGAISGAVRGVTGAGAAQPPVISQPQTFPVRPTPGIAGFGQRFVPGGRTGFEAVAPNGGAPMTRIACHSGYHANKSAYFLRDGTFVPKGSRCVKNRRRNPLNPRALDRSIGRIESAKRIQTKLREIETGKVTKAGSRKD